MTRINYTREEVEAILQRHVEREHLNLTVKDVQWSDYNNPSGIIITVEERKS